MNTYTVTFINKRRVTLREEFVIAAASATQAKDKATRQLEHMGYKTQWYMRPQAERRV